MSATQFYHNYLASLAKTLESVEVTERGGRALDIDAGMAVLCELSGKAARAGKRQFFCGNGASAAFSSHMALDWSKNAKVPTLSFADGVFLTALVNDLGADEMYASALRLHAGPGDVLATISSSGNSPNILKAIGAARELGMEVVTVSGLKPDNASRALGDVNFYFPGRTYGIVECAHQALLHAWLDAYMEVKEWDFDGYQNMNQQTAAR